MSSSEYSAEIRPDPVLRALLLWTSSVLLIIGAVVTVTLPFHGVTRVTGLVCWLALGGWEFYKIRQGHAHCQALRISADKCLMILDRSGNWRPARLLSGSVVLRRFAWIRIADAGGCRFAEPLRGHCRENENWRHLQVIWRHIGATRRSC